MKEALSESTEHTLTADKELEPEPESKSWTLAERIKVTKKKVTASQKLHIEMEAAEARKERHGKPRLRNKY